MARFRHDLAEVIIKKEINAAGRGLRNKMGQAHYALHYHYTYTLLFSGDTTGG
jgi:hypothetical protein